MNPHKFPDLPSGTAAGTANLPQRPLCSGRNPLVREARTVAHLP